jgi:hypothetical protein
MLSFLLEFTLVPNSALLFLKLLVFEFRLGISETLGYSALVPHANTVPLLDLRQLLMTLVRMMTIIIIIVIFILFHRSTHGTQPQDIEHVQLLLSLS